MLRRLSALVIVLCCVELRPAEAQTTRTTLQVEAGSGVVDLLVGKATDDERTDQRSRNRRPVSGTPSTRPSTFMMKVELRIDPVDGGSCAYLYNVAGDPRSRQADAYEQLALRLVPRYGACSNSPVRRGGAPAPAVVAAQVWREQVQLPAPALTIAPGFALTGKPAYLEVGAPRRVQATYEALGESVAIDATSVLDVDWGDGTVETGLTRQGGPWPERDISHVYTPVGDLTGTAPLRWSATWRVGQATGRIDDGLLTTGALPLEVRQLQAVRDR